MRVTEPIRIANEHRSGLCEIANDSFSDHASEAQTRIRRQMRLYPRTAGRIAGGCLLCPKRFNHPTRVRRFRLGRATTKSAGRKL